MIRLHDYWRSSAAYRLRIALNLMEVDYAQVAVDLLASAHKAPAHLALNPQGLVPVLEIDGLVMTQSLAIIEYLDEVHGAGFLPEQPAARARVRALSYAIAMEIAPVCNLSVRKYAEAQSGGLISADGWQAHFIAKGLAEFELMLAQGAGAYCHGDRISMADICLVPQLYNARRAGLGLAPYPQSCAIEARLCAVRAIAAALPENHAPA